MNDVDYEPGCYERFFERIELLPPIEVKRGNVVVRRVQVYRCVRQLLAFPFLPGERPDQTKVRVASKGLGG